jgi:protein-tyrosine phosphatase
MSSEKLNKSFLAVNHVLLEGAYNVRDVGGYMTNDGRVLRHRTLFRADSLHALTETDRHTLLDLGIRTIIDLRHPQETTRYPNVFAGSGQVTYLNIPFYQGWRSLFPEGTMPTNLTHLYTAVLDNCHHSINQVLTAVSNPHYYPLLVHCQIGKDRTGMLVALLLGLLGVPFKAIAADYAVSYDYLQPILDYYRQQAQSDGRNPFQFEQILQSKPESIIDTLCHLQYTYGSFAAYFQAVGLSSDQLDTIRHILTI